MSIRRFFQRKQWDTERAAELESHLQIETDRNVEAGMSPADARAAAYRKLGNPARIRETIYAMNSIPLLDALGRDLRLSLRSLCKKPGFAMVVVLSLALGIGANTAIFSLVDGIIFRPLPVPDPGGLVTIDIAASRLTNYGASSYLDWVDLSARSKSFQALSTRQDMSGALNPAGAVPDGKPQVVWGQLVSGNFFSMLGVQPALGRAFLPEEEHTPGKYPVMVISYSLWNRMFARNPDVIGKQVRLSGQTFTIIGVTPESFAGVDLWFRPDLYLPMMMTAAVSPEGSDSLTHRDYRGCTLLGRLKPGVTIAQSQAEMKVIMSELEREYPASNKDTVAIVRKEMDRRLENGAATPGVILMGLVVLILMMACANVASLMMAKAASRIREISTQLALGASRGALVRQFLTESAVLALLGGGAGILLAAACIRGFSSLVPYSVSQAGPDFHLDLRVLGCAALACVAAVFLCGLAPAFMAVKEAVGAATTRSTLGGRSHSAVARRILIGGQVALSVVLLVAGGLFLRVFLRAQSADLGFNPDHMLLVTLDPSLRGYKDERSAQLNQKILERVSAIPGVKSATMAGNVPFLSGGSWDLSVDGYTAAGGEKFVDTNTNQVGPNYFSTMQIPLLSGREFTASDTAKTPQVAIVNETLARRYIVNQDSLDKALGHILRLRDNVPIQIVGVVRDSSNGAVGEPPPPVFYLPYLQQGSSRVTLQLRAEGDPTALTSLVRRQISAVDSEVTPLSVLTMVHAFSTNGLFRFRIFATLGGAFGLIALSLAIVGLYGVVSFVVGRRTQEIGIRMAMGAQRSHVLRMILVNGISLAAVGVVIGMVVALAAAPLIRSMLNGVSPRDPLTFAAIAVILLTATFVASWIPARRATRVDPNVALRCE
ncbi:MAG TPA: ABC transporter permease [Candidatus Dormibacteraeota bacterium]|nr:ABC transporter permease [Candidatus Dormibacteraeota bacterium]